MRIRGKRWRSSFMARRSTKRPNSRNRCSSIESLERRTLFSTYVVNGTAAADNWNLEADAGQITLNGTPIVQAGLTDVLINGLDGGDSLFVLHTTIPIT